MRKAIRHYWEKIRGGYLQEMLTETKWMLGYAKQYRLQILYYIVLGVSGTLLSFASSVLMKYLIDAITSRRAPQLALMFSLYIGFLIGNLFISYFSGLISAKIRVKVENEIRADIYRQIMDSNWERMAAFHSGELLNRLNGDVTGVSSWVLDWIPNLVSRLVQFFGALAIILYYDPTMIFFALLGAPVTLFISRYLMGKLRSFARRSREVTGEVMSFNEESLQNVQTIKSFGLTGLYGRLMEGLQKKYADTAIAYSRFTQKNSLWMGLLNQTVSLLCFGWCVYRLWTGHITFGTMTMFLSISSTLSTTVYSLINLAPSIVSAATSAGRLRELVVLPKEEFPDSEAVQQLLAQNRAAGLAVSVEHLDFAYSGGAKVFEDACLTVKPGEIVALVGPSGEGKTTLLRILLSLMPAQRGKLFLTGTATGEQVSLSPSTRSLFSYVPQGNTMFSGTIAENMRLVQENATDGEIVEALKTACAYDFVSVLPEGIHSKVGEHGGGFSEGQAQRLSIARALLRDAPIFLLDEATSALDVETERRVLRNIMRADSNKACIVTTHRPSVLGVCSRVYRIGGKCVVAVGQDEISRMMQDF